MRREYAKSPKKTGFLSRKPCSSSNISWTMRCHSTTKKLPNVFLNFFFSTNFASGSFFFQVSPPPFFMSVSSFERFIVTLSKSAPARSIAGHVCLTAGIVIYWFEAFFSQSNVVIDSKDGVLETNENQKCATTSLCTSLDAQVVREDGRRPPRSRC